MKIITNDIGDLKRWLITKEKVKVINFESFLKNPEEADLVYFSGGEDVSPHVYNEPTHPRTYSYPKRDILEMRVYYEARLLNIPMVGVCRGGQFLTAMQPGGRLVQDVGGHSMYGLHGISIKNKPSILTTSTHHQMMYPFEVNNYELIAVSSERKSNTYSFGYESGNEVQNLEKYGEPEIVYYPDSKCLAIQGHPEYFEDYKEAFPTLCRELVFEKCLS